MCLTCFVRSLWQGGGEGAGALLKLSGSGRNRTRHVECGSLVLETAGQVTSVCTSVYKTLCITDFQHRSTRVKVSRILLCVARSHGLL